MIDNIISKMKRTPVTYILILINIIVFILTKIMLASNSGLSLVKGYDLYVHGGIPLDIHAIFSILLSGFTHFTLMHIFFNMLFLYYVGPFVEVMIETKYYLLLYFGTLFISGIAIIMFTTEYTITIGASGALYGLLGFLIIFYFLNKQDVKKFLKIDVLIILVAINFVISFTVPGLSRVGYISGFVAGCMFAFLIDFLQKNKIKKRFMGS